MAPIKINVVYCAIDDVLKWLVTYEDIDCFFGAFDVFLYKVARFMICANLVGYVSKITLNG